MASKFSLEAVLSLTDNLTKSYKQTTNKVTALNTSMNRSFTAANTRINNMAKGLAVGVVAGVAAASAALVKMTNDIANSGDEIAKTSRQIGVSAEALQELRFAADRQGVSSDTLTGSLQKLNKNVGDLRANTGSLKTILEQTNPALADQLKNVSSNEEAFGLLVKQIGSMENQMDRAALSQAAFGRSGQDMLKLFEAGPEGIAALREEAAKYGLISTEAANQSEAYVDALTNIKAVANGLKITLVTQLIPAFTGIINSVKDYIVANKDLIAQNMEKRIKDLIQFFRDAKPVLKSFIGNVRTLIDGFNKWKPIIKTVLIFLTAYIVAVKGYMAIQFAKAVFTAVKAFMMLAKAQGVLNALMAANPIGLIVLGIAALIAIIVLLVKHWDKVKAAMIAAWDAIKQFFSTNKELFIAFLGPAGILLNVIISIFESWNDIKTAFQDGGFLKGILAIGKAIWDGLVAPIKEFFGIVQSIVPFGSQARERREGRQENREERRDERTARQQAKTEARRESEASQMRNDVFLHAPSGYGMSTEPGGAPSPAVALGGQ